METLKTQFDLDTVTVDVAFASIILTVQDGVNDQEGEAHLSPKQARKIAKALKRAARASEAANR